MDDQRKVPSTANTDEGTEVQILTQIYEYVQRDASFLGILRRVFSKDDEGAMAELKQIVD